METGNRPVIELRPTQIMGGGEDDRVACLHSGVAVPALDGTGLRGQSGAGRADALGERRGSFRIALTFESAAALQQSMQRSWATAWGL